MANLSDHITDEQRAQLEKAVADQAVKQDAEAKKDRTRLLASLVAAQRKRGFRMTDSKVRFTMQDADQVLMRGLVYFCGERAEWLAEYEEIAEWLTDNDGKGLMCIGDCGRGKTLITQKIIPLMFENYVRLADGTRPAIACHTALDLLDRFDEIAQNKSICIDDIGTEPDMKKYGVTHNYFSELVDLCERKEKLLICSTNLSRDELTDRYGIRTMDRLTAITRRVFFEGESLRG